MSECTSDYPPYYLSRTDVNVQPGLAIAPIRSAMMRLDPTTGTFTSTHLRFIQLCMETRSYAAAEPILNNYIHTLPAKIPDNVLQGLEYSVLCEPILSSGDYIFVGSGHSHKVTLSDVQEYYILGAMAYLGMRQFKKAQQFLEHVLVVPTANTANGYMLEAYKKWVLIGCLVDETVCATMRSEASVSDHSQPKSVPRTANGVAIKQIKNASKAYDALAEAYCQLGNLPKLNAQIKAGADIWIEVGG
jgi:COP9 signalosome complex subunit 3